MAIDYAKYSNMNERQLLNSLLNAEKKEAKLKAELQEKLKDSKELIKFLKVKLKESLDSPKYDFIAYEKSQSHKLAKEFESTLSKTRKAELMSELDADINRNYVDEL